MRGEQVDSMAAKSKTYDDFLKSFRIALANTSVYFTEHPLFVKSVDNLRKNIGELLLLINPLKIGIIPDSLAFGGEYLKGIKLYEEIAAFFHLRKIKTISFKEGVSNAELIIFLANANLSPKDILLKGGLSNILEEAGLERVVTEDLDYSQLLKGEGEEYGDIWLYLLRKSLNQGDAKRIDTLADGFQKVLKKLRVEDLVDNKEINESISKLLVYLKDKDKNKFSQCSKALTKSVLKNGGRLDEGQINKLKNFLQDLDTKDISNALLEQLQDSGELDSLSLSLFSKFINREKHEGVASFLAKKLEEEEELKNNPKVIAGVKELITLPDFTIYESKAYHDNLMAILENITLGDGLCFDRNQVVESYRLVLLDLFVLELSPKRLEMVLNAILGELDKALEANDSKYLESFKKAVEKKKGKTPEFESIFAEVEKGISAFVEKIIFKEDYSLDMGFLIDIVNTSSTEAKFYLDKIFKEGRVSPDILKLFFKLFSGQLSFFCAELDKKTSDVRFVEEIMKSLTMVKPSLSLEILKHIFSSANDFIKIKVLEKMEKLHLADEGLLFSILKRKGFLQRKQALLILAKNPSSRAKAAQMLLDIRNPFGLRSKIIEENLGLAGEVPFPEAKAYLIILSKYKFFWNKNIRLKAKEILTKNGV